MPDYKIVKCPICHEELRRETLNYYFDETKFPYGDYDKDTGESAYYCNHCGHSINIIHDLNNEDRAELRWREMRL